MSKEDLLEQLWNLTIQSLIGKIAEGDYTSQDLNIARQLLKDHGMTLSDAEDTPIAELADVLPFTTHQTTEEDHPRETFG